MEWQPIETAPKDGTVILGALIFQDTGDEDGIYTIRWHEPWRQWVMAQCLVGFTNTGDQGDNSCVTHWMPLPPSPWRDQ